MIKSIDLDNSCLYDEERYRSVNSYGSTKTLNKDYFTVDGEIIRDFKDQVFDPYTDVLEFDGHYFDYGETDLFVSWLLDSSNYGVSQLFNEMTPQGKRQFLLNGFKQEANEFGDMLKFTEVKRS